MDYKNFKETLSKFSTEEIKTLIGVGIYNSLSEWRNETSLTLDELIDVLISVNGFSLFKNKKFRERYFKSVDQNTLRELLNDNTSSYEKLAKKASSIEFDNNDFYNNYIHNYLKCEDYIFEENKKDNPSEEISRSEDVFYELFDYQYMIEQQVLYEINKKSGVGRNVLVHMPTGTGKTKTTMHIISNYLNFSNRSANVLWIADRNELLGQAFETFKNVWSKLGTFDITAGKMWVNSSYNTDYQICFCTIQTLVAKFKKESPDFKELCINVDLIVFDECHKISAPKYANVLKAIKAPKNNKKKNFIGLTATPGRTTNYSMENTLFKEQFERIVEIDCNLINRINMPKIEAENSKKFSSREIISYFQSRGFLSVLEKEELKYKLNDELIQRIKNEYNSKREDYSDDLIKSIANNRSRNRAILNKLKELNSNNIPTIVFACSKDHAILISAFLRIEGVPNSLVHGEMDKITREQSIKAFKDRHNPTNIIVNYDILTTGFDSKNIKCVFITRPTKSIVLYSQMIGRGLRGPKMGGNKNCLLIDVKENIDLYDENEAFSHFNNY